MVMITNTAKFNISKDSEARRPVNAGDRVAQATKK
jgi:PTS system, glucose subfamily, IIA component